MYRSVVWNNNVNIGSCDGCGGVNGGQGVRSGRTVGEVVAFVFYQLGDVVFFNCQQVGEVVFVICC